MTNSTPGSTLAALRRQVTRTCPRCGREFTRQSNARYCSASCRSMASRERTKHLRTQQ